MEYIITCPRCNKKFKLTAHDESKLIAYDFICNKCGFKTPFVKMLPQLEKYVKDEPKPARVASPPTHISGGAPQPVGAKTKISGLETNNVNAAPPRPTAKPATRESLPLYFEVEKTGRKIYLSPGTFTLGRDSRDSSATLKVAPDPYMSRECARLDVNLAGNTVRINITPLNPKNPVCVNDSPIAAGVQKPIKLGDRVLLGATLVTLKIKK